MVQIETCLEDLIILNTILNARHLNILLEYFKDTGKILGLTGKDIIDKEALPRNLIANLGKAKDGFDLDNELCLIKKHNVKLISFFDSQYPVNLKDIYDPPILLYVKGDIVKEDELAIAIVGSRRPSLYGISVSQKLGRELSNFGITVVSGLARGIDTASHNGAINNKGRTIAVLGSGLANIYPAENKILADKITQMGAVISEFPMQTKPVGYNFPRRNRIISGLSLGTVVVEAAKASGALITADFAMEQNREVFAVPGNVNQATSFGTNHLIKQGAKLVEDAFDIIEELRANIKDKVAKKQIASNNITLRVNQNLSDEEKCLYNALSGDPRHVEELMKDCDFRIDEALSLLMKLELKGLIRQLPGKLFIKKIDI